MTLPHTSLYHVLTIVQMIRQLQKSSHLSWWCWCPSQVRNFGPSLILLSHAIRDRKTTWAALKGAVWPWWPWSRVVRIVWQNLKLGGQMRFGTPVVCLSPRISSPNCNPECIQHNPILSLVMNITNQMTYLGGSFLWFWSVWSHWGSMYFLNQLFGVDGKHINYDPYDVTRCASVFSGQVVF